MCVDIFAIMGVNLMVMDCGINLMRFKVPDQVYCNKSQKATTFCLKQLFCKKNASLPFNTDLGLTCTLISCECKCLCEKIIQHVNVNENQQTNMQKKYVYKAFYIYTPNF